MKVEKASTMSAPADGFDFIDQLTHELVESAAAKKAHKTRAALEIAVAQILAADGYHALKVADICARAGVGHGTFYRYWKDTESATYDTLTHFMAAIRQNRPRPERSADLYARILAGHEYYIEVYRRNFGLMRCLFQLADQVPKFAELDAAQNLQLAKRVVSAFERSGEMGPWPVHADEKLVTALSCITAVDGSLRMIFNNAELESIDRQRLAATFSNLWFRAFCGKDADAVGLHLVRRSEIGQPEE
ncbi:TetR/AcrR family transcriptional regulator [Tianweitania sediminis]|uniref:TetR/AcrR family transcriptional regulator n=1 Tax=Tianweitania sediminis TaxID=1502156 RepID=A0A8J7RNL5_9HYPH|nr:TetR/AcrR family transcriptional regulator [Tianweitania sediminis]MBP0439104.1 TetR/AcrR family transcriptional regulator [Tianweitania sediminis]